MTQLARLWHNEPLRVIYTALSVAAIVLATLGVVDWSDAITSIAGLVVALEGGRTQVSPVKR